MDEIRNTETITGGDLSEGRKPYKTPTLTEFGKTEIMTQTGHGPGMDASTGS